MAVVKIGLRSGLAAVVVVVLGVVLVAGGTPGMGVVGPVNATEAVYSSNDGELVFLGGGGEFSDLTEAGVHRANVETLAERGILDGTECAPGQFCPNKPIHRWVMAVWLVRAVDEIEPGAVETSRFVDVDVEAWWMPFVERLADLGITRGCALEPARFCPTEVVTRQQMASFLVRAFQLEPETGNRFVDVELGNVHLTDISSVAEAGITAGCGVEPARYCPTRDTTRAEMATFLARALGIDSKPPSDGTTPPSIEGDFTAIAAGFEHACALRTDATVTCWGQNRFGQAEPPVDRFTRITAGRYHTCGIRTDQTVKCWGAAWAIGAPPDGHFTAISAGVGHSCGITTHRTVECWSGNHAGESTPPEGEFVTIAAGDQYTCGVRIDATVVCWGLNDDGQADPPDGQFTEVVTGKWHSCGLGLDSLVTCWGANWHGELLVPIQGFLTLAAGESHSCGIETNGTVTCWGAGFAGADDPPEGQFIAVTSSWNFSCGLRSDRSIVCWGDDFQRLSVPKEEGFTRVDGGPGLVCGLRSDRSIVCWGHGELGLAYPPDEEFTSVTVSTYHACGIRSNGTVVCWGGFWEDRTNAPTNAPEGRFVAIAAGGQHSCAIGSDLAITCWGNQ